MIEKLFHYEYSQSFHCVHFAIEAAKYLYQKDYSLSFIGLTNSLDDAIRTSRSTVIQNTRIDKPKEGCIVLMTYHTGNSHVGIFYKHRIFHLCEQGVQRITLEQARPLFKRIRFYEPNLNHS